MILIISDGIPSNSISSYIYKKIGKLNDAMLSWGRIRTILFFKSCLFSVHPHYPFTISISIIISTFPSGVLDFTIFANYQHFTKLGKKISKRLCLLLIFKLFFIVVCKKNLVWVMMMWLHCNLHFFTSASFTIILKIGCVSLSFRHIVVIWYEQVGRNIFYILMLNIYFAL